MNDLIPDEVRRLSHDLRGLAGGMLLEHTSLGEALEDLRRAVDGGDGAAVSAAFAELEDIRANLEETRLALSAVIERLEAGR